MGDDVTIRFVRDPYPGEPPGSGDAALLIARVRDLAWSLGFTATERASDPTPSDAAPTPPDTSGTTEPA